MRILVIEDNDDIRALLSDYLKEECFAVDVAATGEQGSRLARTNDYDIVILDYMLPDKDGLEVCKEIRAQGKTMPILMVSVLADTKDKVMLLNSGADDYISKPFSLEEVRARIAALLRRPPTIMPNVITIAYLTIDPGRQKVFCSEQEVYLTRKEFSLLEYLARNEEMVVSRGMIMEHVWNMESDPFSNTIEAHIFNLRKKIACADSKDTLIRTVPGRGYKLSASF